MSSIDDTADTADTIPDQDTDLELIRSCCDAYLASPENDRAEPPDAFFDAVARQEPVLRRTAVHFKRAGADEDGLMPPATLRFCASYLLTN